MMSLSKLAKLANVSVSTASKAFSGSREVNEETREMIFEVARKHRCFRQFFNAKYPKPVVVIICPEFESRYYSRCLSYLQTNLEKKDCEICVASCHFSAEREEKLIEYYDKYAKADGIIVVHSSATKEVMVDIPVVYVGTQWFPQKKTRIIEKYHDCCKDCFAYLKEKKVERIGFLGEKLTMKFLDILQNSAKEQGVCLEEQYISISEKRFEAGGYDAMEKLFLKNTIPRAIFCAYNELAIGAIKCIQDHGLSVPNDIAVIGNNDNPEVEYLNPPLASISSGLKESTELAVELLMKQMDGEEVMPINEIPCELKHRESFLIDD